MLKLVQDIKAKGGFQIPTHKCHQSQIPPLPPPPQQFHIPHQTVNTSQGRTQSSWQPWTANLGICWTLDRASPPKDPPNSTPCLPLERSRAKALPEIEPEHSCVKIALEGGPPLRLSNINVIRECWYALHQELMHLPWTTGSKGGVWLINLSARKKVGAKWETRFS